MTPIRFWFAVMTLIGFVIVTPAWMYFTSPAATGGLPREVQFLVALVLPLSLMLTLGSWLQPR